MHLGSVRGSQTTSLLISVHKGSVFGSQLALIFFSTFEMHSGSLSGSQLRMTTLFGVVFVLVRELITSRVFVQVGSLIGSQFVLCRLEASSVGVLQGS